MKDLKKFTISKKEVDRRIKAFTTLIISFLTGIIIFSFNYILSYYIVFICFILILAVILFSLRRVVVRYFNSIIKSEVILNPKYIIKDDIKYLIKDIKKIYIKRTTGKYVREIKIVFNNNTTYINGINDLDEFTKNLESYLSSETKKVELNEPINYDHPTFYLFLGIILSIGSIELIKFFATFNKEQLVTINYIVITFTVIMGLYFIMYRPVYKRNEKNSKLADYILGTTFIIMGILILLLI